MADQYKQEMPNKALHRMAIPLRSIAAGEFWRYPKFVLSYAGFDEIEWYV
ncbi:MAG: hypothetical protein ABIF19_17230 [Planctomycetota bacterium]